MKRERKLTAKQTNFNRSKYNGQNSNFGKVNPAFTAASSKGNNSNGNGSNDNVKKDLSNIKCFGCSQMGHYANHCPNKGNSKQNASALNGQHKGNAGKGSGNRQPAPLANGSKGNKSWKDNVAGVSVSDTGDFGTVMALHPPSSTSGDLAQSAYVCYERDNDNA